MSVTPVCHEVLQPIDIIKSPIQLNQCLRSPLLTLDRGMKGIAKEMGIAILE